MDNSFKMVNSKKEDSQLESVKDGNFNIFIIIIIAINCFYLYANKDKVFKLVRLFTHHDGFIPSLIGLIIWIIFIFILKGRPIFDEKHPAVELLIKSTNAGLFALIIALFAYIDLVLPVFWFVLLIHFIFNDPSLD